MHSLTLLRPGRSHETHLLRARRFARCRADHSDAFFPGNEPHRAKHAAVWTWFDNSAEASVLFCAVVDTLVHCVVLVVQSLLLMILEDGDLAATKDSLEGKFDEEFGGGG